MKKPTTPRGRIRSAIRQVFLRSRERAAAVKREKNTCEHCGVKGSVAKGKEQKIQVHHKDLIQWEEIVDYIFERVLVNPDRMIVLCPNCHGEQHKGERDAKENLSQCAPAKNGAIPFKGRKKVPTV